MNVWIKKSTKNLLRLSEEKEDFNLALKEWTYTGNLIDHEAPTEQCELCEHDELRYHFEIKNALENVLWVGSKCIDKFDIAVFDRDGKEITTSKERYLIKLAQKKHQKTAIEKLTKTKPIGKMGEYSKLELDEFCNSEYLINERPNARILNYLFIRFEQEGIFYEKRLFSIKIRSEYDKEKLLSLKQEQFERIKPALKSTQVKYYIENRKQP